MTLDNHAILQLHRDLLVARRRSLLNELTEVNRQLDQLRETPTKAERERQAYEERVAQRST
jgi:vacuolar-type H+-ATPase subunit D/Vma8